MIDFGLITEILDIAIHTHSTLTALPPFLAAHASIASFLLSFLPSVRARSDVGPFILGRLAPLKGGANLVTRTTADRGSATLHWFAHHRSFETVSKTFQTVKLNKREIL